MITTEQFDAVVKQESMMGGVIDAKCKYCNDEWLNQKPTYFTFQCSHCKQFYASKEYFRVLKNKGDIIYAEDGHTVFERCFYWHAMDKKDLCDVCGKPYCHECII